MEGFLTIHKDKICPNKFEIRDLRATYKLIFDDTPLYDDDQCLEVAITRRGPIFDLRFYRERLGC